MDSDFIREHADGLRSSLQGSDGLLLFLDRSKWIHRRVEALDFVDQSSILRTVEIEFSLPTSLMPSDDSLQHIPVALVPSHGVGGIRVTDEAGGRVSILTSIEARRRVSAMLITMAHAAARVSEFSEYYASLLAGIVHDAQNSGAGFEHLLTELDSTDPILSEIRSRLLADEAFVSLTKSLTTGTLLFIGVDYGGPVRRIVTLRYEQEVRGRSGVRAIPQAIGLRDTLAALDVSDVGMADMSEYHLRAPGGVEFSDARLVTISSTGEQRWSSRYGTLVTLGVTRDGSGGAGVLLLSLRAAAGYPMGVFLSALFTALILTVGYVQIGVVRMAPEGATTLLLAGPAVFTALASQPRAGTPGAQLVIGARVISVAIGLLTFLAGGSLVAFESEPTQEWVWLGLMAAAWAGAVLLAVALVTPRVRAPANG